MRLLIEGIKKAGKVDTDSVIKAMEGLTIKAPWGVPPAGTVTMRDRDHTVIYYATGWGHTIGKFPFVEDMKLAPWDTILRYEEIWLKEKSWLK